jgi:DNA-binding MarR family transcriptional regulator
MEAVMHKKYAEAERFRYLILAFQRQGNRMLNTMLSSLDLTSSQAEVLTVLRKWEPISLKDLGRLLICETGSPSRLIDRMATEGLVKKIADPLDSRCVVLKLTQKGQSKVTQIMKWDR